MYIVFALFVTVFLFILLGYNPKIQPVKYRKNSKQLLSVFGLLIVLLGMFVTVEANSVGIVYDPLNGGLQEASFDEGLHIKAPWVSVTKISTKLREASFEMFAQTGQIFDANNQPTGGGQFVTYDVTLQYKVTVLDAYQFFKNFGSNEIPESTLKARIREALQDNSTNYDVFSILKGALSDVRLDTETQLRASLLDFGVYV
jgi:regulator of protease activity HflC (stomatin/prohibitin superfamily)